MAPAPTTASSITTAFLPTRAVPPIRAPRLGDPGPVTDVRRFLQHDGHAGEHVDGAALLHVAAVGDLDGAPVPAEGRAGADVGVAADPHVAGDGRVRVDERGGMHHGDHALELIDASHPRIILRSSFPAALAWRVRGGYVVPAARFPSPSSA